MSKSKVKRATLLRLLMMPVLFDFAADAGHTSNSHLRARILVIAHERSDHSSDNLRELRSLERRSCRPITGHVAIAECDREIIECKGGLDRAGDQADLSGTYVGTINYPEGNMTGEGTLTITGNRFKLTSGSSAQTGSLSSLSFPNYTTVAMRLGDSTSATTISLRATRVGVRLTLSSVRGEQRVFLFNGLRRPEYARRRGGDRPIATADGGDTLPSFPWPPPTASAVVVVPSDFFSKQDAPTLLRDVSERLTNALDQNGYGGKGWYAVPGGFALASGLEQFEADGRSLNDQFRFVMDLPPPRITGVMSYLRALVTARQGHYRVIVFIVTPHIFTEEKRLVSPDEARLWPSSGANALPQSVGDLEFTSQYLCTALIYEFERATDNDQPVIKVPGSLTARAHLERAGIWHSLLR